MLNLEDKSDEQCKKNVKFTKRVDYDELLSSAGEFKTFQIKLCLLTIPFYVFGGFTYFTQMFITQVSTDHWCWIPELQNLTVLERKLLAIPEDSNAVYGYDRCRAYVANWSEMIQSGIQPNGTWEKRRCQHGWEFNKSDIPYATIGSEDEWVCDKNSYQASAQSAFFIGSIVGGFLIGWMSDRYGRVPAIVFTNLLGCFGGVITIFANDIITFSICRFIVGISYDNCMMTVYLLIIEYVVPRYRTLMVNIPFSIFYTISVVALPQLALACNNWKILTLATSLPQLIVIIFPCFIPESPRWLLYKGRVNETIDKIKMIAFTNKIDIPEATIEDFKTTAALEESEVGTQSIIDLLKCPPLRKSFISLCLLSMCCTTIFDVLVRSIEGLGYDFFLSFTILSLTEFPSIFLLSFILDASGRKCLSVVTLSLCGIFSILSGFNGGSLMTIVCAMVARFCINMAFSISTQWGAEVLPTSVRGSAVSIMHTCGCLATVISPFIAYLSNVIIWLPLLIVGLISFAGAWLSLSLPETANKEMPQTFAHTKELLRNSKIFEAPFLNKKTKVSQNSEEEKMKFMNNSK